MNDRGCWYSLSLSRMPAALFPGFRLVRRNGGTPRGLYGWGIKKPHEGANGGTWAWFLVHGAALELGAVVWTQSCTQPWLLPHLSRTQVIDLQNWLYRKVLLFCDLCGILRIWKTVAFSNNGGNKGAFLPHSMEAFTASGAYGAAGS